MDVMGLDDVGATYLPWLPGSYLLSGRNEKLQCGYNDFEVTGNLFDGYFVLVTGTEG